MVKKQSPCVVHAYHWPPLLETQLHHVWPLGMGGPDVKENKVWVCPTGHRNIHWNMRALNDGTPMKGTKKEKEYAQSGYDSWLAANKPGRPELWRTL